MKKNKGITLIALVVTLVILLVLAGITIAALRGENGLLSKTKQAIEKYGVIKGCGLGALRILKCNPFSKGGFDPLK